MTAVVVRRAPDLFSFGLFRIIHPQWIGQRILGRVSGPPALDILPDFVFYVYNFTHSLAYVPTPYLWPLTTPYVRGISWATGWFMAVNYSALLLAYIGVVLSQLQSADRRTV